MVQDPTARMMRPFQQTEVDAIRQQIEDIDAMYQSADITLEQTYELDVKKAELEDSLQAILKGYKEQIDEARMARLLAEGQRLQDQWVIDVAASVEATLREQGTENRQRRLIERNIVASLREFGVPEARIELMRRQNIEDIADDVLAGKEPDIDFDTPQGDILTRWLNTNPEIYLIEGPPIPGETGPMGAQWSATPLVPVEESDIGAAAPGGDPRQPLSEQVSRPEALPPSDLSDTDYDIAASLPGLNPNDIDDITGLVRQVAAIGEGKEAESYNEVGVLSTNIAWQEIVTDMTEGGIPLGSAMWSNPSNLKAFIMYYYLADDNGKAMLTDPSDAAGQNVAGLITEIDQSSPRFNAMAVATGLSLRNIYAENAIVGNKNEDPVDATVRTELKRQLANNGIDTGSISADDLNLFLNSGVTEALMAVNNAAIPIGVNQTDAKWDIADRVIADIVARAAEAGLPKIARDTKLGNPALRKAEIAQIARELGFDIGSGMNAMDRQSYDMAVEEIDRRISLDGPGADIGAITSTVLGTPDGVSFLTQYGVAAPPSAPIVGGQQAYRDLIASGNYTADDIMATVYGLPDMPAQKPLDIAGFTESEQATLQGFIVGGDTAGLTNYLKSINLDPSTLEEQYRGGSITPDEYEFVNKVLKQTSDIADVHAQYGVPVGGDPYKGIYNPYAPPEEIDSRLYAPAAVNIGFEDLPPEGVPGAVRYDAEGRPLGRLYSDIIVDLESELQSAQDDYGEGVLDQDQYNQITSDITSKINDASAAKSAAEAAIAADKLEEEDYVPPEPPPPPAPEMTQFRTRTRGGARGF